MTNTSSSTHRYKIIKPLTQGGMANLYLATSDQNPGMRFVIKKVMDNYSTNSDFVRMFQREVEISLLAKHPNLVQTIEAGSNQKNLFIILEYIDGTTLKGLRKKLGGEQGRLNLSMSLFIIREVARGLSYLHHEIAASNNGAAIIHLDVSPQNVMISRQGQVKLIDFGIAKSPKGEKQAQAGAVTGKFAYMSPEQARGEELTPASDIFSLGLMLMEMATGQAVFQGLRKHEIAQVLSDWKLASYEKFLPQLPGSLVSVVKAMLDPVPENRPRASILVQIFHNTLFLEDVKYDEAAFRKDISAGMDAPSRDEEPSYRVNGEKVPEITLNSILNSVSAPKKYNKFAIATALALLLSVGLGWTFLRKDKKIKPPGSMRGPTTINNSANPPKL